MWSKERKKQKIEIECESTGQKSMTQKKSVETKCFTDMF